MGSRSWGWKEAHVKREEIKTRSVRERRLLGHLEERTQLLVSWFELQRCDLPQSPPGRKICQIVTGLKV